ncbi:hypothetical protein M422DRAFT_52772 [Sphaerobolus stellatus SS14]|uniref:Unplaced genomic scaffold SPHSTscaffold_149, whole genome shotgun sequence n=1 Tax=Sphaerobolus stellatus (strain SS14) TaxID=990650 RepID=A0A0C9UD29_SPHS4|nr:hypothetical protein M422DRAFT_52772 [Sphaerobolus stellatus SS14]
MVLGLRSRSAVADGSQYRPRVIEQPNRAAILKLLQQEDGDFGAEYGTITTRRARSVGINRGLEVELRQVQFKHQRDTEKVTTDIQWNKRQEAHRKLSQSVEGWFRRLANFMPADAVNAHQKICASGYHQAFHTQIMPSLELRIMP